MHSLHRAGEARGLKVDFLDLPGVTSVTLGEDQFLPSPNCSCGGPLRKQGGVGGPLTNPSVPWSPGLAHLRLAVYVVIARACPWPEACWDKGPGRRQPREKGCSSDAPHGPTASFPVPHPDPRSCDTFLDIPPPQYITTGHPCFCPSTPFMALRHPLTREPHLAGRRGPQSTKVLNSHLAGGGQRRAHSPLPG